MRIEVLTLHGCPHADATRELVRRAVRLEGVDAALDSIDVERRIKGLRDRHPSAPGRVYSITKTEGRDRRSGEVARRGSVLFDRRRQRPH